MVVAAFDHVLTLNERILNHTLEYEAATVTHSTFLSDGYGVLSSLSFFLTSASAEKRVMFDRAKRERNTTSQDGRFRADEVSCFVPCVRPFLPSFSFSSLFSAHLILRYGGPHSQTVDLRFSRDWHEYVACGLEYIVVVVDGRGTGYKGRKLRNPVKGNLGYWETVDQVNAAR